ncbi:CsbD family protein [Desulfobacter sp. UBA2225]|uniref:CsbD family protein n=1 Tax=Desulfobacter sp. UBA2225 TaxID=1961413 RepID=UPI00257B4D5A|nr:CsbD family protein [Desulfobacter sp. UBA2225]
MKSSTRDNAEGNMHQVRGKIKEVVGKTVRNSNLEAEGTVEKFKGKVQKKIGRIKKALDK